MKYEENKVELTGFSGGDPEFKELGGNKKLAKVSIAVNDHYKTGGGSEVKNTLWFNLVFWNGMADEAVNSIKKGTRFSLRGKLLTQQYEGKDGLKRLSTEIVVQELDVFKSIDKEEIPKEESSPNAKKK